MKNNNLRMGLCDELEFDNTYMTEYEVDDQEFDDNDLDLSDDSDEHTVLD